MEIQPLADRVIVKPLDAEEISKGGIVLPDTAKEKPQEGKVLAVGKGKADDKGKKTPLELQVTDVFLKSDSAESLIPGKIIPPSYSPFELTKSKVMAVPKSIMIAGFP